MNAFLPTSDGCEQPVAGASPPYVFTRWMNVVRVSRSPPVGPSCTPTFSSNSHGTEFGRTNLGSNEGCEGGNTRAHTVLVSRACHAARIVPLATTRGSVLASRGSGFGPKKWVIVCLSALLNSVASGVNRTQAKPLPEGEHA